MAVPFNEPLTIVRLDKLADHLPRLLRRREVVQIQTLLLQRPNPPLQDAITVGLADVARRSANAELAEFTEELMRGVLRAPVHPEA